MIAKRLGAFIVDYSYLRLVELGDYFLSFRALMIKLQYSTRGSLRASIP